MIVPCVIVYVAGKSLLGGPLDTKELYLLAPLFTVLTILVGVMAITFRKEAKKLALLRDGDVASARVITQEVIARGKHSYNQITYEFQVPGRPLIRKAERDHTKQIFEDVQIPVFYNSAFPDDCVVLCRTYYSLRDAQF